MQCSSSSPVQENDNKSKDINVPSEVNIIENTENIDTVPNQSTMKSSNDPNR